MSTPSACAAAAPDDPQALCNIHEQEENYTVSVDMKQCIVNEMIKLTKPHCTCYKQECVYFVLPVV